jgi:hypothetical protein
LPKALSGFFCIPPFCPKSCPVSSVFLHFVQSPVQFLLYSCILSKTVAIFSSFFLPRPNSPQWATASSLTRFLNHTQTHHSRQDPSGQVISPSQRPLPDNTQHSPHTNFHAPVVIRTQNLSRRAPADPRL